jgi:Transposase DDE domain group 1
MPWKKRRRNGSQQQERNQRILRDRKRRIQQRINPPAPDVERTEPMFAASNIHYEIADRARGIAGGGIGAIHLLARNVGLIDDIDRELHLLKRHLPYFESDHVLNIAYNILAGGSRLEHIEIRRNDEVFLDALGAERIPDPTTAGDFCRRFSDDDVLTLMNTINKARLRVWKQQPDDFFDEAIIDADGTLAPTDAECKEGIDIAYDGTWGYHPLLVSLANTAEPLFLVNRPGNRPSHEQAAVYLERAISLCRRAGFRKITLRGDTDFSQTEHLDGWDGDGVQFYFGYDAFPNLKDRAEELAPEAYTTLERPARYAVKTVPRNRPENHKQPIVEERGFTTLRTIREEVAEFDYRPTACSKTYRMVVLRKTVVREVRQMVLFEEYRYFFYITNDRTCSASEVVFQANDRCDQENLIAQIKSGVHAMTSPVDTLISNGAYMVMASLAWSLKAWLALMVPIHPRWSERHRAEKRKLLRMEFATFQAAVIQMPCQIVRGARRIVFRLLSWTPWQGTFLRLVERLHGCRLC